MRSILLSMFPFLQVASKPYEDIQIVVIILQFIIAISILNVWVLQYRSMSDQFQEFNLPGWTKNAVGVTKGILCVMLIGGIWMYQLAVIASIGIAISMLFAIIVHMRARHDMSKIIPAIILGALALVVAFMCYRYKFRG